MKYHRVKYCSVRIVEKLTIKGVADGIKANLSSSTVGFEDEPDRSWWACNTPDKSHWKEWD